MVTFIAPAFNEDPRAMPLVSSLLAQTSPHWKLIVYHNGPSTKWQEEARKWQDARITYRESPTNTGAWGCYNRATALGVADTVYVVQTSIQDYYLPGTVNALIQSKEADIIVWYSINHLIGPQVLEAALVPGRIDWGNAAVRTSLAQAADILYPEEFMADWLFYKTCLEVKPDAVVTRLPYVLTIHN
jgi:glycosyltransferase involved in cell wall biosynthesis